MKRFAVCKAQRAIRTEPYEGSILKIGDEEVPEISVTRSDWELHYKAFYDQQSEAVVEALMSLPGATLDRVLAKLISRSVSLHRIPWEEPK